MGTESALYEGLPECREQTVSLLFLLIWMILYWIDILVYFFILFVSASLKQEIASLLSKDVYLFVRRSAFDRGIAGRWKRNNCVL